jgi:type II secretory pathway pseudopilin PulG
MNRPNRTFCDEHEPAPRDAGLTLIELVVSIGLLAILAPVIAAAFTVSLRTTPRVDDQTDAARTLQGVVTWLPQDIDSTPPTGFDTSPTATSGCTLDPGTNLLRLEWSENIGAGTVRFIANYRLVLQNGSHYIQRITCNGIGAGPLGNSRAVGASSPLPPLPVGWTEGQLPYRVTVTRDVNGDVTLVTFEVQTFDGSVIRTDSAPKNPANTLAPTTTESVPSATTTTTTPPTTTTTPAVTTTVVGPTTTAVATTTSTTVAPTTTLAPCTVVGATLSPTSVRNTDPNGNGRSATNVGVLGDAVTLTVTTAGGCTGLEARAQTGAPNGELFHNFSGSNGTYSVTFPGYPQGSSELWSDGLRTITVHDANGGPYTSIQLDVK